MYFRLLKNNKYKHLRIMKIRGGQFSWIWINHKFTISQLINIAYNIDMLYKNTV